MAGKGECDHQLVASSATVWSERSPETQVFSFFLFPVSQSSPPVNTAAPKQPAGMSDSHTRRPLLTALDKSIDKDEEFCNPKNIKVSFW